MSPNKEKTLDNKLGNYLHLYSLSKETQEKVYCYLEESFRKDFFEKFRKHFGTIVNSSKILKTSEDKIRGWMLGKNVRKIKNRIIPIQASFLFRIAKELDLELDKIEKKIIAIKTKGANSHLLKNPNLPIPLDYSLGRLLGISLGDGHLTQHSTIVYANNSDRLIDEVIKCVNTLGKVSLKVNYSDGMKYLIIPNVIGCILNELGAVNGNKVAQKEDVRLAENINSLPDGFRFGIISGLLDDEGSVIKDRKYGKIYFEQHIPHIVKGAQKLLNDFGIETSNIFTDRKRPRFYFYIYRKPELKKVLDMMLFRHPEKIIKLKEIVSGDIVEK